MPSPTAITDLSQTASSNYPAGSDSPATLDDVQRAHASFIAMLRDGKGASTEIALASASTTDIGGQNSKFISITGTTTITSFGTNYNGPRFLRFAAALTLTHNATTLILPGGANITTSDGDLAIAIPKGTADGWYVFYAPTVPAPFIMTTSANRTSSGYFTTFSGSSGSQINASTGIFTCAKAGVYSFTANFRSTGTPGSTSAHTFNLSASRVAGSVNSQVAIWYDAIANPTKDVCGSFSARMAVGDTARVEVLTYGPSGTTVSCTLFTGAFVSI